jgi:hypothetical protein
MSLRRLALSSVMPALVCAVVASAAPAQSPKAEAGPCQTTTSGHRWMIAPRNLSCSDAKNVVAKLADKKVPAARFFRGTYEGMRCLSTSRTGTKPQYIACGTKNHSKSLIAFRQ